MRAAVLIEQNAPLETLKLDLPKLDVGQALVKVEYSGIAQIAHAVRDLLRQEKVA